MKRYLRASAVIALVLVCVYFAFRGVNFRELWESLKQANYYWIVPATLLVVVSMVFRAFRWRCLLSPMKAIGFMDLFSAINICFMANNFLPARSGEFIRAILIGKKHRVNISTVLATVVLERIFDAMCVMGLFLILIFSFTVSREWKEAGLVLVVLYGVALALLVLGRIYSEVVQRGVHRVLSGFSSGFAHRICALIDSFLQGLNVLKDARQVALIVLHSVLVWASIFLTYYYLCLAFEVRMPFQGYLFLLCALALAVMAPIPGYVASFHAAYKAALVVFKYPPNLALACAIVAHGVQYIAVTLLGLVCLRREGVSFGRLKVEEKEIAGEIGHEHAAGALAAPAENGERS